MGLEIVLDEYPQRFRARIAGRVDQVRYAAAGQSPRYEAEVIVAKSRPVTYNKTRALITGLPAIEVAGDFAELSAPGESTDPAIDATEQDVPTGDIDRRAHPSIKFPDYPPLKPGTRVLLVWHGQRSVPGVVAGTELRCNGMLSTQARPATMYNPRYEIVPQRAS